MFAGYYKFSMAVALREVTGDGIGGDQNLKNLVGHSGEFGFYLWADKIWIYLWAADNKEAFNLRSNMINFFFLLKEANLEVMCIKVLTKKLLGELCQ